MFQSFMSYIANGAVPVRSQMVMKTSSVLQLVAVSSLLSGCAGGPALIKPGSPAFFWAVAQESYRTGDLLKAQATLLELGSGDSEFAERARTWHMVVSAGVAQGLTELADAYQDGSRVTAGRFRQESVKLRSMAASAALEFTQDVHNINELEKTGAFRLAFGFPPGSVARPADLAKVAGGTWLGDSDREALQRATLQRGVILAASRAVGSPDDPSVALASFQVADVQIPRETLLFGVARMLYDESDLFGPKHLDRPERLMVMCREAQEALSSIPETEGVKALGADIRARTKLIPGV